jgi:putative transposase
MPTRRVYDSDRHAHFLTFSCYKRRRLLDSDRAKKVVLGVLNSQLAKQQGRCAGFVVMPDHVHAIVWFPADNQISHFVKQWKQRASIQIKRLLRTNLISYAKAIDLDDPVWQAGYYDFNIYSERKLLEKLNYMHRNPVEAGLVERAADWPWSSARHHEQGRSVGVPVTWLG